MTCLKPFQWLTKYKSTKSFNDEKFQRQIFSQWQQVSPTIILLTTNVTIKLYHWQQVSPTITFTDNKCHQLLTSLTTSVTNYYFHWQEVSPTITFTDNKCHQPILTSICHPIFFVNLYISIFTPRNYFFSKK